jgi:hypothetical protein
MYPSDLIVLSITITEQLTVYWSKQKMEHQWTSQEFE